jgi:hypothetical protein
LILVDARPRRRQEQERYRERCREAEAAGDLLRTFDEREVPAFKAWIDSELAREVSRLRHEEALVRELHSLVLDVERYAAWTNTSLSMALARLRRAKAEGTEAELWREAAGEDLEDELGDADMDEHSTDDDDDDDAEDEAFSRRFAEAFADAMDDEDAASGRQGASRHPQPKARPASASEDYLKSIYRQLVRVLHPDTNPDKADQVLWQQVQDAYKFRDLARLERLRRVVLTAGARGLDLDEASIGDLIGLRKSVESRLRQLRTSLRSAKAHPAWDFLTVSQVIPRLRQLKREVGAVLADELTGMQQERRQLEMWLASLGSVKRAPARKGRRGKQAQHY